MKNKILLLVFSVFFINSLYSQIVTPSVVASAGDSYQNTYAYMDITIGEVVTETMTGTNYILTNGFQQGHYNVNFIQDGKISNLNIDVFPNPAKQYVILNLNTERALDLKYEIFDLSGRKILQDEIMNMQGQKNINLQKLTPGSYYLRISSAAENLFKNIKIVKM